MKNKEFTEHPYSLANILYNLSKKETKNANEIAMKLTKNYWSIFKNTKYKKRLPSLWANMTWSYVINDEIDETFEEIVEDALKHLKEMPSSIYENLAWFYLKKKQIDKCIYYLKEGKNKNASKYDNNLFKALADHPEYKNLFD